MSNNITIEPRLIALLNDELVPCPSPSLELPPLHDPNILKANGRPLLLEPDASIRNGKRSANPGLPREHNPLIPPLDDDNHIQKSRDIRQKRVSERALGSSSPQSLRKILDDDTERTIIVSKKRQIVETSKEDFVQLPQPPKKQRTAKEVFPPIIIGLHEPPPQATLFPPIASSSFHDSHGRNSLNTVPPKVTIHEESSGNDLLRNTEPRNIEPRNIGPRNAEPRIAEPRNTEHRNAEPINAEPRYAESRNIETRNAEPRNAEPTNAEPTNAEPTNAEPTNTEHGYALTPGKKLQQTRVVKARKKWTEEETNNLLLGVQRHGVGNWADIVSDDNFTFNGRSATDLKDRFRTVGPKSKPGNESQKPAKSSSKPLLQARSASGPLSANILIEDDEMDDLTPSGAYISKQLKSRAHRKNAQDLAQLGIEKPFTPSLRRERKAFSEEEDRAILEGYNELGASWAKIQQSNPALAARQARDLRDRFRNRYPELYRGGKGGKGKAVVARTTPSTRRTDPQTSISAGHRASSASYSKMHGPPFKTTSTASHNGPIKQKSLMHREGVRIQEIISAEQEIAPPQAPRGRNPIPNFRDHSSTHVDPPSHQSSEQRPLSQPLDWSSGSTAPYSSNIGEMDISRLLLNDMDESWHDPANVPTTTRKERPSFTDINSLLIDQEDQGSK